MQQAAYTIRVEDITRFDRESSFEDLGVDFVHWVVHFEMDGKEFWALPDFESVWQWLKKTEPATAQYFDRVREDIVGWGPKHTQMFAVFDEEDFDFKPLVARYIAANTSFDELLKHYQRAAVENVSPQKAKAFEKKAALKKSTSGAAKYSTRWDRFAEALLAFATEKAVEVYPEILTSDPERIKQLGYLLYDKLRDVADGVAKLADESKE